MVEGPPIHSPELTLTQKELISTLHNIGAIKFGQFRLKLHEEHPEAPLSPIYIDLRLLRRFPEAKAEAVGIYHALLEPLDFDLIADIPTAATPLAASISDNLNVGMITPRADKKLYGSGAKIDGLLEEDLGKTVVAIDDLITKAHSKVEAITTLRTHGLLVNDVVVLIDREQGGQEQLERLGVNLHHAFTLPNILDHLHTPSEVRDQLHLLNNYMEVNE